jgi:beta propeller domain-containing protein
MTGRLARLGAAGFALCAGLGFLSGCSKTVQAFGYTDPGVSAGSFQLVAFDSCDGALAGLRSAAKAVVGPYGFTSGGMYGYGFAEDVKGVALPPVAAQAAGGAARDASPNQPAYSGTNTHEIGVDEPDLVKTDGRRIVTVSGGVLRVVDAASRRVTGRLDLVGSTDPGSGLRYATGDLLLYGDHALVLLHEGYGVLPGGIAVGGPGPAVQGDSGVAKPDAVPGQPDPVSPRSPTIQPISGPRLFLVDLAGTPRVLATYTMDGGLLDARQTGATARVVVRSYPRLVFPNQTTGTDAQRTAANQKVIDKAGAAEWLPRFEVTGGGSTKHGQVSCAAVSRPASYTGTNLLTVLTFQLDGSGLGDGSPVTIAAEGDTVYSNGDSLYIASDSRWRAMPMVAAGAGGTPPAATTEIYKFDTRSTGRPRYLAGGGVPGYLINQYALSDLDGKLRVATSQGQPWMDGGITSTAESGVYVLAESGKALRQIGHVGGLGRGERIYAVRFVGTVGYVVTFRQTDPLYTIDLHDPTKPTVVGELKINGYSAYLHPVGEGRLLGIGQDATSQGITTGSLVSLFDVSNPGTPRRLAHLQLAGAHSNAEFDPHAFLYWPATGLIVVPIQVYQSVIEVPAPDGGGATGSGGASGTGESSAGSAGGGSAPADGTTGKPATATTEVPAQPPTKTVPGPVQAPVIGALVLRRNGDQLIKVGFIEQPSGANPGYPAAITRSLMIGDTLWTVSDEGLMATDPGTLDRLATIRFS